MDATTQIILSGVSEINRRLEAIAANVDARAERQARSEEQWKAAVESLRERIRECREELHALTTIIIGDGNTTGIKNHMTVLTSRVSELETASQKIGVEGKLQAIEKRVESLASAIELSKDIALVDREGQWNLKVESLKAKVAIIGLLVGSVAGLGELILTVIKFFKGTP
jgi:chromosome segregation ATPase